MAKKNKLLKQLVQKEEKDNNSKDSVDGEEIIARGSSEEKQGRDEEDEDEDEDRNDDEDDEDEDEDDEAEEDDADEVADNLGETVACLGVENAKQDLLDDEADEVDETEETEGNTPPTVMAEDIVIEEVIVGKKEKKKVKVKRLPLHRLASRDIFEVGKAKMIAIDLPATRH